MTPSREGRKDDGPQRAAELLADFGAKLAKEYAWDEQENWEEAMRIAKQAVDNVNAAIA